MILVGANFSTNGVPTTGLSPIIFIYDVSDSSVVINGVGMSEIANGSYKYEFTNDTAKEYSIVIDGGSDALDSRYLTAFSERAKAEAEIVDLHQLQGLDIAEPMTVTPTSRTVGTIEQTISGDNINTTTVQRVT